MYLAMSAMTFSTFVVLAPHDPPSLPQTGFVQNAVLLNPRMMRRTPMPIRKIERLLAMTLRLSVPPTTK